MGEGPEPTHPGLLTGLHASGVRERRQEAAWGNEHMW